MPMGKLKVAELWPKPMEAQKQPRHQPHISVSIAPWQVTWVDQPKRDATKGLMMVGMGVAITLLIKKWADTHGLTVKEKVAKYILGTNGTAVKIIGMTSMTLFLVPTLEIDVSNVANCLGNFYQGLLGCDLLCRHNEVLGTTAISVPGPD